MMDWAFWGTIVAVVIFAGFCELRRSYREASRTAVTVATLTCPQPAYTQAEADADIEGVANAIREDPLMQFTPGLPGDDEINVWMTMWAAKYGSGER